MDTLFVIFIAWKAAYPFKKRVKKKHSLHAAEKFPSCDLKDIASSRQSLRAQSDSWDGFGHLI